VQASKKRSRSEEEGGAVRADKKLMDDVRAAVMKDGTFAADVVDKVRQGSGCARLFLGGTV
jgi:hypothetical protein